MEPGAHDQLHDDFPDTIWVVVTRQTHGLPGHEGDFLFSDDRSLFHANRFAGAFGRVSGLLADCSVIVVCDKRHDPGDVIEAHTCGVRYLPGSSGHTLIAVDAGRLSRPCTLSDLDELVWQDLNSLFRDASPDVGWFGRQEACDYLAGLVKSKKTK